MPMGASTLLSARMKEWLKALLLAFVVLFLVHRFVLRWVVVQSTSMYSTLLPGDLIGVERWPTWTGLSRGDIVVFRDPIQDDRSMARRQLLVKRIAGMPGDVLELRNGVLWVNNERVDEAEGISRAYLVRVRSGSDPQALLADLDLPNATVRGNTLELPLTEAVAAEIGSRDDVVSVSPMRGATGAPRHIFPYSQSFRWNSDDFGPLKVPAAGDTLRIDVNTFPLYDRLITRYEANEVTHDGSEILLNGEPLERYVVKGDQYFVLGDARDHSADSRYWGFVPADHVVGRAGFVLLSQRATGGLRSDRWLKGLGGR